MNPAFSIAHMKRMIPMFHSISKQVCLSVTVGDTMSLSSFSQLREIIIADIKRTGSEETDIMDMMGKAALYVFAVLEWPVGCV